MQKIEYLDVRLLKPHPNNPRKINAKQIEILCQSIQAHPDYFETRPILCNKDMVVFAGNMRVLAAQKLGLEKVPVSVMDISEERQRELMLRDNIQNGNWDKELLGDFDEDLLLGVGFESDFLDDIFDQKPKDDDFDADEAYGAITEPKAKYGEIYQLGQHRIGCLDATKESDLIVLMGGGVASMVFTDPPYNVDYTGGMGTHEKNGRDGIMNDKMCKSEFYQFLLKACKNLNDFCAGGQYICMSSSKLETLKTAYEQTGGHWQTYIVWVKDNFTLSRSDYQHTYEPILYGWPAKIKNHYFIDRRDIANVWENIKKLKTEWDGEHTIISFQGFKVKIKGKVEKGEIQRKKQKADIWRFNKPTISKEHPTMKPIEMVAEAIKNSSTAGQIVLDTFLGSGTTLIAAEQTNRRCYGCELDPKFIDVIIQRYEKLTGNKATKIS